MTTYVLGAELPDYPITWRDGSGAVIDFATGWTFTLKLGIPGTTASHTKTTGITGAATAPNIVVAWAAGELDSLTPGTRVLELTARSAEKDRVLTELFTLVPAIT